jgi:quinol-cytochrome oxidoreductase complex cytochrome b subunit
MRKKVERAYLKDAKETLSQFISLAKDIKKFIFDYPAFANLGYMWNFGFISAVFLILQIVTGFILSTHYVSEAGNAFLSVEAIMREVNYG